MEQAATKEMRAGLDSASQYLAFALGEEQYGIELLKVQEIKGYSAVTPIPNTPEHIKGVMNLRGSVIPIIDLRIRFGMPKVEYTQFNVIIVINVGAKIMGLLVDAVSDVLNVTAADHRPAPDFGSRADTRFISGIVSSGDRIAVLLDIARLLSDEELAAAQLAVENADEATAVAASP